MEVPGQPQEQLKQTLIVGLLKTHLFLLLQELEGPPCPPLFAEVSEGCPQPFYKPIFRVNSKKWFVDQTCWADYPSSLCSGCSRRGVEPARVVVVVVVEMSAGGGKTRSRVLQGATRS